MNQDMAERLEVSIQSLAQGDEEPFCQFLCNKSAQPARQSLQYALFRALESSCDSFEVLLCLKESRLHNEY